jgi:hypothetical protein
MTKIKVWFDIAWIAVIAYFVLQGLHSLNQLSDVLKSVVK